MSRLAIFINFIIGAKQLLFQRIIPICSLIDRFLEIAVSKRNTFFNFFINIYGFKRGKK